MRPEVSEPAEEIYAALSPGQTAEDEALDWPLLRFCEALAGPQLADWWGIVQENWETVLDPETAPRVALAWAAQFSGVTLLPEWTEAEQREEMAIPSNWKRGRRLSLERATARHLTGTKRVIIREREGGAYRLYVRTYTAETASEAQTLEDVLSQKPGGLVLDYDSISVQDWILLESGSPTWDDVLADYEDWHDALENLP